MMISRDDIEAFTPPTPEECLEEFIMTFKASLDPRLWVKLIKEESKELRDEKPGTVEHLKEAADLLYVLEGFRLVAPNYLDLLIDDEELEDIDNLLEDVDKAIEAAEGFYGHNTVYDALLLVHDSNMSKLDEDGNPIFREDGKVLKGPNYRAPDLTFLI
jgi:hypothetical protein